MRRSRPKGRMVEFVGAHIRTCVGCGRKRQKEELIRLGVDGNGNLRPDGKWKKVGRGVYVCRDAGCIKATRKSARLERIYGREIPDSVFKELEDRIVRSYREPERG
jgi:predicted RNA-binding protein YlxR (DUF448 family)